MSVRVRIAPSPTGNLHIGTARTAVFNWLYARHYGGKFILRIEDTDLERSRQEYTDNIFSGLTWLGIDWDEGPFYQSLRLDLYRQGTQTLLDKGLAYRCYCTSAELEQMREQQTVRKEAPRYDNRHRHLTPEQRAEFEAQGRKPVIRLIIDDDREIIWQDRIRGKVSWKGSDLGGDMVIARTADQDSETFGQPLYNLAVVIDDIDMNITHVIRGEDHIANTAKQILLYEGLGAKIPEFAHSPLILNIEGKKLSKRDGATSIDDFKAMGFLPEAMTNYMTLLGWTAEDSTKELFTLSEAAKEFSSLERINKAGAKFDIDKLDWINSQYLHHKPASELVELLKPYWQKEGFEVDLDSDRLWWEKLTALITPSLTRLTDAVKESRLLLTPTVDFSEEAVAQLKLEKVPEILQGLAETISNKGTLTDNEPGELIQQITKSHNVKKGLVMKSLRAALMGELHGPDLIQSWLLLNQKGWDKLRLQQAIEK